MVAIFTGHGAGVVKGSASALGGAGVLGSGSLGRAGEGVSVNAATGNLVVSRQDEFLVGRGLDAGISRTYNSLAEVSDRDNGDNWQQSTTRRVFGLDGGQNASGSSIKLQNSDGSVTTYSWATKSGITAYWTTDGSGSHDRLAKSGANWLRTDGDSQVVETYGVSAASSSEWRLIERKDTDNNKIAFSYLAGSDKLNRVTTANGDWLRYVWSGNNITKIETGYVDYATSTSKTLSRTWYDYSGGRLSKVRVDLTPQDNVSPSNAQSYWSQYSYDSAGRLSQIIQKDGSQANITYDVAGRVATISQQVTSSDTRTTSLSYGKDFTNVTGPDGQITRLDYATKNLADSATMKWGYSSGYVTAQSAGSIAGEPAGKFTSAVGAGWSGVSTGLGGVVAGDTITFTIDLKAVAGSATTQSLGLYGSSSAWGSDATTARVVSGPGTIAAYVGGLKRVSGLSTTEATRIEITRTYSQAESASAYFYIDHPGGYRDGQQLIASGARVTKEARTDGSYKQLTKVTAPPAYNGAPAHTVQFLYDSSGNVTRTTDANGKQTNFVYDAAGNVTKITDPNLNTVERWYDAANRMTRERVYASSTASANTATYSRYAYDSEGHLRYTISGEGRVTEYRYTGVGQLQYTIEYPEHGYPVGSAIVSEATMDAWRNGLADRQSTKITSHTYDARGNKISSIDYGYATSAGGASTAEGYAHHYYTYDQAGRLLTRRTASLNTESFVYDGMGRTVASVDLDGGTTSVVFDDTNSKTVVTTAAGGVTTQTYNKAGELIASTSSGSFDVTGTSNYKYDKNGRLRVSIDTTGFKTYYIYDKAGQMVGQANHYGHLTEFRYDKAGRVIAEARYTNAVSAANKTALENPDNTLQMSALRPAAHSYDLWAWTVYDAAGRVTQSIDGQGGVANFEYDKADRLVKTTSYYNKVSVAALKSTPPLTAVSVAAHARDSVSRSFYDRSGRLVGALDGEGYLSEIVYDNAGQKVEEVAYVTKTSSSYWGSGTFGQLRSTASPTNANNRRMHYVYDGKGQLRFTVDSAGRVTQNVYWKGTTWHSVGLVREAIVHGGTIATSDYSYDSVKAKVAAITSTANDRKTTFTYDGAGNVLTSTNAGGTVSTFAYDSSGRVTKTQIGSGATARISRNYYTAQGLLRFSVDAEGYVRRLDYDAAGRNTRVVTWNTPITVSDATTISQVNSLAAGSWTDIRHTYDAAGRRNSTYDGEGNRTVWSWYATGQLSSTFYGYATADQSRELYVYDGAGNLTRSYGAYGEAEQTITWHTYDGLGNRLTTKDPNGKTTTFVYDETGRAVSMTNAAGGTTSYQYNAYGEVTQTTDPRGANTVNTYNKLGQLTRTTDAGGFHTDYTFTQFGDIATVKRAGATTSFQYDKLGRVTRATDALGFYEAYTYDAFGNRITSRNKLGGTTTYAYDKRGLLTSETLPIKSYTNAASVASNTVTNTYLYDARGNRTRMVEAAGLSEQRTTLYAFDKANRLIRTTGQTFHGITPVSSFAYDARGNLTRSTDPVGAKTIYYYDDLGRVTSTISPVGTYSINTYDKNGNVTSVKVYKSALAVPADGGSQEEAPAAPSGGYRETTFAYDNLNRMTSSSISGVKTGYYNGSSWIAATSAITTAYQYDANGNVVKMTDANGNATHSYYDLLGRKTGQVDADRYFTKWIYDGNGNVTTETRYAVKVGTPTVAAQPASPSASGARVTKFTYDLNGNRLSEARQNVLVHNGSGAQVNSSWATVSYLYNGLGQVTRKTEATGDKVNYTYDQGGRLTLEQRQAFTDHKGHTATPTVDYYYNGVGDLARTRQRGNANAAERITTYGYDGDKLRWMKDAEAQDSNVKDGVLTYFWYDAAGRQTHEYAARYDSAGALTKSVNGVAATTEGMLTAYDLAGRVVQKWQATNNATEGWVDNGPRAVTTYNTFGEVVSVAIGGRTQTNNTYDDAGRLVSTSAGDGVWKHFGHDKNGNQTVSITSAGTSLSGKNFDQALTMIGQAGVNGSYTAYDARNMATTVTEEGRQLAINGAAQSLTTSRSYNAFGEVANETNALGAKVTYTYNNAGRLIRSESPTVQITLENGSKLWVKPSEDYYYDVSGRLVATRDANGTYATGGTQANGKSKNANTGNLTILTLLKGSGYGGSEALVTSTKNADNRVKSTKFDIHGDARILTNELGYETHQTFDRKGRLTVLQELRQKFKPGSSTLETADDFYQYYAYDGNGQQLKQWNNVLQTPVYGDPVWVEDPYDPYPYYNDPFEPEPFFPGDGPSGGGHWETPIIGYTPDVSTTDYDMQGRVTRSRAFGGDVTEAAYSWDANQATSGLGTFGGWVQTTTMHNGKQSIEKTDLFGRTTYQRDLGGNPTTFVYDVSGRVKTSKMGGLTTTYTWLNNGSLGSMAIGSATAGQVNTDWTRDTATYNYDKVGNRIAEHFKKEVGDYTPAYQGYYNPYEPEFYDAEYHVSSTPVKNQTAAFDALGRMTSWNEVGTSKSPASSITNEYDAAGNVRRTLSTFRTLDANGSASTSNTRDLWFRYDKLNRVVVNQGQLIGGVITHGVSGYGTTGGQTIAYNEAGQRTSVAVTNSYINGYTSTSAESKELYFYDSAGRLQETRQLDGTGATGNGVLRSRYVHDKLGRQTAQYDYDAAGNNIVFSRTASFNLKSQLTSDYTSTKKTDGKTYTSSTSYAYGAGTSYALGAVLSQTSSNRIVGENATTSKIINTYRWYGGAVQATIKNTPNTSQSTQYTTTFTYDGMGRLTRAYIADGKPHTVTFTNDELGQVIRRDETSVANQTGAPHEVWYRYSGRQLGYTGNNGTNDMSMAASISDRQVASPTDQGTFRNKQKTGAGYADFAQNYDPINSYYQGSAGGSYTVRRGDTMHGIAQQLWGDSSLWYKIAEANGMGASTSLIEGQRLILPTGVLKNTNNAGTIRPYDPGETIGDLAPTTSATPQKKKGKCGTFGLILLAVVAIAVATIVTAGAASVLTGATFGNSLGAVLGGSLAGFGTASTVLTSAGAIGATAIGAVAGSIVSQGLGVATGIQEKFSWKGVALAGIGSVVGGAIGANFGGGGAIGAVGRAAAGSAITQGIGVATGLQDKFSWVGVAAAGVGAGVAHLASGVAGKAGHGIANGLGLKGGAYLRTAEGISRALTGSASAIANAATRSAIEGTSFGQNVLAAMPDVIANALQSAASACFTGETLIHTPIGLRRIDEIRVGDLVYSRDESFVDERVQIRRVIKLYRFEERATLDVIIAFGSSNEETIRATPEHPFAVINEVNVTPTLPGLGFDEPASRDHQVATLTRQSTSYVWQAAGDLEAGNRVIDINGRTGMVVAIEPVGLLSTVHNFSVEDHHTYFVGRTGTWVHNRYGAELERLNESIAISPTELDELSVGELTALANTLQAMREDVANGGDSNLISAYRESAQNILFEQLGRAGIDPLTIMNDLQEGVAEGLYNFGSDLAGTVGDIAKSIWNDPGGAFDAVVAAGESAIGALVSSYEYWIGVASGDENPIDDLQAAGQWFIDQANMVTAGVMLDASIATGEGGFNGLANYIGNGIGQTVGSVVAGGVAGKVIQIGTRAVAAGVRAGYARAGTAIANRWAAFALGNGTNAVRASVRNILAGNGTHKLKEALGLVSGARMARAQGFEYLGDLQYGSNNGIDGLLFNGRTGQYAFLETKGHKSGTYSLLTEDSQGMRQGSLAWNRSRLQQYIDTPEAGRLRDHAIAARAQMQPGGNGVRSFASFRGSGTFHELLPMPGNPNDFVGQELSRRGRR